MSSNADRLQLVREFIVQDFLFGRDNGFASTESMLDSGMIDSTGVLQLVAFLEQTFGIKIIARSIETRRLSSTWPTAARSAMASAKAPRTSSSTSQPSVSSSPFQ